MGCPERLALLMGQKDYVLGLLAIRDADERRTFTRASVSHASSACGSSVTLTSTQG
jgi:hypothetical protein